MTVVWCDCLGVVLHPGDMVVTDCAPAGYGTGRIVFGVVADRVTSRRARGVTG